jgi:hypothetical protein
MRFEQLEIFLIGKFEFGGGALPNSFESNIDYLQIFKNFLEKMSRNSMPVK